MSLLHQVLLKLYPKRLESAREAECLPLVAWVSQVSQLQPQASSCGGYCSWMGDNWFPNETVHRPLLAERLRVHAIPSLSVQP